DFVVKQSKKCATWYDYILYLILMKKTIKQCYPCHKNVYVHYIFKRGSSASRNPSPNKLNPKTTSNMARPGKVTTHGEFCNACLPSLNIAPHSGVGGCAPNPRKLSPAASKIAVPILNVA